MELLWAEFVQMELTLLRKVYHGFFQMAFFALITILPYESAFGQDSIEVTEDSLLFDTSFIISSFGVDENLELYVMDYSSGQIFRFTVDGDSVFLTDAFPNLNFARPGFLTHSPDGTDRIFILEIKSGNILVFPNDQEVTDADLFLDIGDRIDISAFEGGLLGLAFHPDYVNNGFSM